MIKPKQKQSHASSEAGYTILEGIMAIVVVTVLLVAISPMIGFAAAVRMQAKRTQLAAQAARSYISFVKTEPLDNQGNVTGNNAPGNEIYEAETETSRALAEVDPPGGGNLNCDDLFDPENTDSNNGYCDQSKVLYCVNFDETDGCQNDSPVDMVIQPIGRFRTDENGEIDTERGYELAVRVYRASSFVAGVTLQAQDDSGQTENTSFMGRRDLPLVQITTSVPPKTGNLYSTFCNDLGGCD